LSVNTYTEYLVVYITEKGEKMKVINIAYCKNIIESYMITMIYKNMYEFYYMI